jgi:PAS domain S-box-containing protein
VEEDERGEPLYASCEPADADVIERMRIENLHTMSEGRQRLISEHANDVLWSMSPDGRITHVSRAVEAMRGFTPEEAMRQPLDEILTPESQAVSYAYFVELMEALQAGRTPEAFRGELEYRCKDGSTTWADVQTIPHINAAGELVELLGVSRDISDQKRQAQELRAARDEADAANRALAEATARLAEIDKA